MLLDPLILTFCLSFQNQGNTACRTAMQEVSETTKTTAMMNLIESEAQNRVKKNINEKVIFGVSTLGYMYNIFKTRQIIAQVPLEGLNTELTFNMTEFDKSYALKWKYDY